MTSGECFFCKSVVLYEMYKEIS